MIVENLCKVVKVLKHIAHMLLKVTCTHLTILSECGPALNIPNK